MATHFIEFRTREGLMCLVRDTEIGTVLETVVSMKGKTPFTLMYVLLRNNNRIEVVGETRETIMSKIMSCTGMNPVILAREPEPEPEEIEA